MLLKADVEAKLRLWTVSILFSTNAHLYAMCAGLVILDCEESFLLVQHDVNRVSGFYCACLF